MSQAMVAEYEVVDETLEPVVAPKPKKASKAVGNPVDAENEENAAAENLATMMQDMANQAAKKGMELGMSFGEDMAEKKLAVLNEKYKTTIVHLQTLEERIRDAEQVKQKTVVVGYKINDAKPVKFKNGAMVPPKFMPWLLTKINVGKVGGNWPFLFGPAGTGKTTACEIAAEILGLRFGHISCTPDMSSSFVYSRQTKDGFIDSDFIKAFRDGGLFLFDEVANAPGSIMIALNNAMTNGHMYNPITGETIKRHKDFALCFADNTNGKGGNGAFAERGRLDGATLNRVTPKRIDYDTDLERTLCPDTKLLELLWTIRVKLSEKKSADVVSTRQIKNAYLEQQAGMSLEETMNGFKEAFDASNASLVDECVKGSKKAAK